jgi:hypothetical protein
MYAVISFTTFSHMGSSAESDVRKVKTTKTCRYYPVMDYAFAANHQFFVEKYFPQSIAYRGEHTHSDLFVACRNKGCGNLHGGIHQFVVKSAYLADTNYLWFLSHEFVGLVPNFMQNFRWVCYHVKHRIAGIIKELARYNTVFCTHECMVAGENATVHAINNKLTKLVKTELWVPTFRRENLWYGKLEPTNERGPGVGLNFRWIPFSMVCEEKLPEF